MSQLQKEIETRANKIERLQEEIKKSEQEVAELKSKYTVKDYYISNLRSELESNMMNIEYAKKQLNESRKIEHVYNMSQDKFDGLTEEVRKCLKYVPNIKNLPIDTVRKNIETGLNIEIPSKIFMAIVANCGYRFDLSDIYRIKIKPQYEIKIKPQS